MSATVRQLLESFDALSDKDKHQVAIEIFRRYALPTGRSAAVPQWLCGER